MNNLTEHRLPLAGNVQWPVGPLLGADDLLALLGPLLFRDPELWPILHDIGKDGTSKEHHVFAARRVLDAQLELGETRLVALQDLSQREQRRGGERQVT